MTVRDRVRENGYLIDHLHGPCSDQEGLLRDFAIIAAGGSESPNISKRFPLKNRSSDEPVELRADN